MRWVICALVVLAFAPRASAQDYVLRGSEPSYRWAGIYGGGTGGFTCARCEIVEILRQRSRPYLFSNAVAPPVAAASRKALELASQSADLRNRLHAGARKLRAGLESAGFTAEDIRAALAR